MFFLNGNYFFLNASFFKAEKNYVMVYDIKNILLNFSKYKISN